MVLAHEQHENDRQDHVEAHEADQRKEAVARGDALRGPGRRAHESVDQPGLAPDLGGDPAGRVRDVGQGDGEHERPEQRAALKETAAQEPEQRDPHQRQEDRPQANHQVVAVIEEADVVGALVGREGVEARDLGVPPPVGEHAQDRGDLDRVVDASLLGVGLAHQDQRRAHLRREEPLHGGQGRRLILRHEVPLPIAGGEQLPEAGHGRDDDADSKQRGRRSIVRPGLGAQLVVSAQASDGEGAGHRGAPHRVQVLPEGPAVEEQRRQAGDLHRAVRRGRVADRVLHPGVGRHDEVAREPGSGEDGDGGEQVRARRESLFAEQKESQERRLEEEGEHSLHRQRLADDAAREARKARPVGAELKLHRNAGDHAEDEVDGEQTAEQPSGLRVPAPRAADRQNLADDDQRGEPHRQLREQIVKRRGEREVEPVNDERAVQSDTITFRTCRCNSRQVVRHAVPIAVGVETRASILSASWRSWNGARSSSEREGPSVRRCAKSFPGSDGG